MILLWNTQWSNKVNYTLNRCYYNSTNSYSEKWKQSPPSVVLNNSWYSTVASFFLQQEIRYRPMNLSVLLLCHVTDQSGMVYNNVSGCIVVLLDHRYFMYKQIDDSSRSSKVKGHGTNRKPMGGHAHSLTHLRTYRQTDFIICRMLLMIVQAPA